MGSFDCTNTRFYNWCHCHFQSRAKSRTAGVKTGVKSPKELLERQINDLEGRVDSLNSELAQVLKTESDLNFTINEMENDSNISDDRLQVLRQQLNSAEQRKDNLLNKVDYLEEEINKKSKELKALKWVGTGVSNY